ncbi:alpha/beta hydrolase [Amycolatopsis speibonae]|uniref:Alpha/beta hydrolase n=1 Tax=Amycolatopsis speibonae TaxID=1450224 RepID=A0ABV7PCQ4_9PSEU
MTNYLSGPRREWANAANALATLRDLRFETRGRAGSRLRLGRGPERVQHLPADGDPLHASEGPRDFETIWQRRLDRVRAGRPLPVQPWTFTPGTSPLQLVGHTCEPVTPIDWAVARHERIGGSLLTVEDDHHGSLSSLLCASKAVEFFSTGKAGDGSCAGAPIPPPTGR